MKRRISLLITALLMAAFMAGCGGKEKTAVDLPEVKPMEETQKEETQKEEVVDEDVIPEGMYRSELTNELISEDIKNQRPIAAMVDNEKKALPHYGLNQADIVYEMMNSTLNGRVTRLMAVVKDWGNIEQLGSIRSLRPTNILLAAEWNAVICHDGGPFYIDPYLANDYAAHFSGTFSRVNNGKPREFTEYILGGDLEKNFKNSSYSTEYDEYYPGEHFNFASPSAQVDFSEDETALDANKVILPFPHNESTLTYNEEDGLYYYSEYGSKHVDAGDGNKQLAFKNVILQNSTFHQYDDNGYLIYNCIDSGRTGYYITNGKAIHISWRKTSDTDITRYFDDEENEITINTGKTYISLIPDDGWQDLKILGK